MGPRWVPICQDREKIVASDSLAGFLRLRGIGTRRVVLDLFGVLMGGLAKTLEIFRETQAKFAHAEMETQADSLPER